MPTLSDVRAALKRGDRQGAIQTLKVVLREKPSADAWYLAATLTNDKSTAINYLQRALKYNAGHDKARDMLRQLGGEQKSATWFSNIFAEMQDFGKNNRVLGRLPPQMRAVALSLMILAASTVSCIMLINLLTPRTPPGRLTPAEVTPETLPTGRPMMQVSSSMLIRHFNASGLKIAAITPAAAPASAWVSEEYVMTVEDAAGPKEVTLYIYKTLSDLVQDRERLAAQSQGQHAAVNYNVAMIYPTNLESTVAALLESTFNTAPATEPSA